MIELEYLDSYKVKRTIVYEDFDDFLLAFSGCVTIPDNLKVISLSYDGRLLPYQGDIGNLYRSMSQFDTEPYNKKKENK